MLILDPTFLPDHLPGFKMDRQGGRGDEFAEFVEKTDELILEPNKDAVKKK